MEVISDQDSVTCWFGNT